jgi:hypothetical protein
VKPPVGSPLHSAMRLNSKGVQIEVSSCNHLVTIVMELRFSELTFMMLDTILDEYDADRDCDSNDSTNNADDNFW